MIMTKNIAHSAQKDQYETKFYMNACEAAEEFGVYLLSDEQIDELEEYDEVEEAKYWGYTLNR